MYLPKNGCSPRFPCGILYFATASRQRKNRLPACNPHAFNSVPGCEFLVKRWHTICSLYGQRCLQDWLPGVAGTQPRLGFGLGGSVLRKRGLAPAPFFILGILPWVVSSQFPWVIHSMTQAGRACVSRQPSF